MQPLSLIVRPLFLQISLSYWTSQLCYGNSLSLNWTLLKRVLDSTEQKATSKAWAYRQASLHSEQRWTLDTLNHVYTDKRLDSVYSQWDVSWLKFWYASKATPEHFRNPFSIEMMVSRKYLFICLYEYTYKACIKIWLECVAFIRHERPERGYLHVCTYVHAYL